MKLPHQWCVLPRHCHSHPNASGTALRGSLHSAHLHGSHTPHQLGPPSLETEHYRDVIMSAMASQITSVLFVFSIVYSGTDQRKHHSSVSLAFVWGIHRWPANSPHKGTIMRKMFPFDDVIMNRHRWTLQLINCFGHMAVILKILFCNKYYSLLNTDISFHNAFRINSEGLLDGKSTLVQVIGAIRHQPLPESTST